ncbi:MAG TPA: hypothetical protein VFL57_19025 [Bryobacteraceae bacterium]|nr:hypothetical protein [Bryobacteraceae bacterium]
MTRLSGYRDCLLWLLTVAIAPAQLVTSLSPETNSAFDRYIAEAEPGITEQARSNRPLPLLGDPAPARTRAGELVLRGISEENGRSVPGGLIHDWLGGMFIPAATLAKVATVLRDADRHQQWYPEIVESKLLARNGPEASSRWIMKKKKVITVVLRADLDSLFQPVTATHALILSRTKPIVEIRDYGTPRQGEYPSGQGHGFLWRFNGYWTLHESDGGVFAECRVISLSRDVPAGLGWIVNPFVRTMPRESVETTLRQTKDAVRRLR